MLEDHRGAAGGLAVVGLVDHHTAEDPAHDGDEALGLEDAQRLAQRGPGDAEALDQVGLVPERVALLELAGDDELPELVGDLLGLLALRPCCCDHRSSLDSSRGFD